jgi:hypothetical protein
MSDSEEYSSEDEPKERAQPPLLKLRKQAKEIVDLEQAVRWEREQRGIPRDGIEDWKRKDIIIVYIVIAFCTAFLAYVAVNN